ncbi:hypothetical protein EV421DRAFT_1777851 [Armillaria borealis]|uniref:Uncharacterized protein n=1 Tax=Armillaria borealis TaxID=47425 RepID=A0AA39MWT9_9AGAR|nr:hypothetical protein EV421DRAFT_1777851 [Armillaria borealis]
MQAIRRPLSSIFKAQKTVTYGLSASRHAELPVPVHRQFTTFASGSLRYASPAQNLRRVHVRTISYSSIPTSIVRVFRVPITVVLVGTGVYWYASYKFEELKRWALACLNNVMLDLALKAVGSRVSEVKLPEIPETWVNDVQVIATNILKSTTNGLNDVGSRIQEVKLPDISETGAGKLIKNLFGGQQHKEGAGENEGSEGERQSDKKRSTDAESEIVDEKDRPPSAQ